MRKLGQRDSMRERSKPQANKWIHSFSHLTWWKELLLSNPQPVVKRGNKYMSTAAASEAAPFNTWTHVNNRSLYVMHCSVYLQQSIHSLLPICLSVFGQLQVAYWTTLKAVSDTELFASLLKAFLCSSHSPFSQWWTFGLVPQSLFQLLSCSSDLQD